MTPETPGNEAPPAPWRPAALRRVALLTGALLSAALGVSGGLLLRTGLGNEGGAPRGTVRTVRIDGMETVGCDEDCRQYNIDTNFTTRPSRISQLEALVHGAVREGTEVFFNGYDGTLVGIDGAVLADLPENDPGLATTFRRIRVGVVEDFDNDGRNEILYGLNSYSLFSSTESVSWRQRRSFEILRTETDDPRGYEPVNETFLPIEGCPPESSDTCARRYDWRIDGDVNDIATADFNRDGWLDIAYLGSSLGDHSWIGFGSELVAAGIPLSNENGARVGVALNLGAEGKHGFAWPRETSSIETHLSNVYPFSNDVDYAPKAQRLLAEDLDGDGNIDLLVAGEKLVVGWGDGTGGFPQVVTLADTPGGVDAVTADFNADGLLDIFVLADDQPLYIDLPRVSCTPDPGCAERGRNEGGVSTLYLATAERSYQAAHRLEPVTRPTSATRADINGDGWSDIVFTCLACAGPRAAIATTDDGALDGYVTGNLSARGGATNLQRVAALDVDDDGDTDLFMTGSREAFRQIWVNETGRQDASVPIGPVLMLVLAAVVASGCLVGGVRRRAAPHPY